MANRQKCETAVKSLLHKYPSLLEEFNNWYTTNGWEDATLEDEFLEDIGESDFVDWITEHNVISNDQEANEIFSAIQSALKGKPTAAEDDDTADYKSSDHDTNAQPPSTSSSTANHKALNQHESIVVSFLSTVVTDAERQQYITGKQSALRQQIKSTAPMVLPATVSKKASKQKRNSKTQPQSQDEIMNSAQDILFVEYLGRKNGNYPLLIHFVDSWVRCQMNEWIKRGTHTGFQKMSTLTFFDRYCNHPAFRKYADDDSTSKHQLFNLIRCAMQSYQGRMLRPFDGSRAWKIDGDAVDLANYLFEMARIVRNCANQPVHNLATIVPIQVEFLVINKRLKENKPSPLDSKGVSQLFDDDDTDDDDDDIDEVDDDEEEFISGDVGKLLSKKKIVFNLYETHPLREMFRCTEDVKRVVDNKRCKRTVFIIDRRKNNKEKAKNTEYKESDQKQRPKTDRGDKVYLFKPLNFGQFEENQQKLVHAELHHNSIKSIVPRPASKAADYGATDSLRGRMLVFSFHIMSKDEVRCYLFYQGQCFRFLGEDLLNVLPTFFVNGQKAKNDLLTRYKQDASWKKQFDEFCDTFVDIRFDTFYHDLTGKRVRIDVAQ